MHDLAFGWPGQCLRLSGKRCQVGFAVVDGPSLSSGLTEYAHPAAAPPTTPYRWDLGYRLSVIDLAWKDEQDHQLPTGFAGAALTN